MISTDEARQRPPGGYFFVGRRWDSAYLGQLPVLTAMNAAVLPPPGLPRPRVTVDPSGNFTFCRPLEGWEGAPVARLCLRGEITGRQAAARLRGPFRRVRGRIRNGGTWPASSPA